MKYSVDDDFDAEFITDILGIGMVIEWITPKINSLNNIQQVFGSSEEKFYSQTNHLNGLKDLKKSLINRIFHYICQFMNCISKFQFRKKSSNIRFIY